MNTKETVRLSYNWSSFSIFPASALLNNSKHPSTRHLNEQDIFKQMREQAQRGFEFHA
jgi:hypothetical protein